MSQDAPTPPRWDMSNVYPGLESEEYLKDFAELKARAAAVGQNLDKHFRDLGDTNSAKLAQITGDLLEAFNQIYRLASTLESYIYAFVSTDSYNETAKQRLSEYEQFAVHLQKLWVRFQSGIGQITNRLDDILEHNSIARDHTFILKETAEQSQYLMSEPEEALAAELNLSGANAWSKLQGTITSQLTVEFELDGKTQTIPIPALINLHSHPDRATRRRAYEAELLAWESVSEPLAAALNGVKGAVGVLDSHRKRQDALHSALDAARIDRQTLDAMLTAMQASFPKFRQYFKAKAARFGAKRLPWWDLFAPSGKSDTHFTFPQARDFILDNFYQFSSGLSDFARRAFDHNWIDAEQRPGKRGGAFCMPLPGVNESRVLCNFDGSLDQVSTIAHELGHAFHNDCIYRAGKTRLQSITPMTLAETASIMCETIVMEAVRKNASSPQEELAILETSLISSSQIIVDIFSRYLFEREVFERRANAELSAAELCEIMEDAQLATYGDGLDKNYTHKYMWTWKPHYYQPDLSFYNFPYAFGLLFGIGLYAIYQERGAAFVPDYTDLLASTGEDRAGELAGRFGIDIRTPEFWEQSLSVISKQIDRYTEL